jgi:hypothetical protein
VRNYERSLDAMLRQDAMLLPTGVWRRVFRILWVLVALNSLWTFGGTLYYTRQFAENPSARVAEGLQVLGWSTDTYFWFNATALIITFVSYFIVALAIFLLRPTERMALFASFFLLAFGTSSAYITAPEFLAFWDHASPLYVIPFSIENLIGWPLLFVFFALYPDGRFAPRWMMYLAIYGFVFSVLWGIFPQEFGDPQGIFGAIVVFSVALVFVGSLYAQVRRYRHYSSLVQRQQTKWLIYGLGLIVLTTVLQQLVSFVIFPNSSTDPATSVTLNLIAAVTGLSFILLPLSIGIAILRYRLWDIDVLIRRTLTYAILSASLVGIYFGSIIALQRIFSFVTGGEQNEIVTVLSTLAIAALFIPLRSNIQKQIDQRFYRKKYDAQKVLSDFAETVRDETDLEKLSARLVQVVQETMQPKSVSVWLKPGMGRNREAPDT